MIHERKSSLLILKMKELLIQLYDGRDENLHFALLSKPN